MLHSLTPNVHSYCVLQVEFAHLPQQRRLDDESKKKVLSMVALKVNKKLLQQHLMAETGQVVILKDIHNISAIHIRIKTWRKL